jgi:peptidoglycan/LPS O-acetylase OafA/YrhL
MTAGPERLHGLDTLRGIAALCVVGLHANAIFPHQVPPWFTKGYLGVDFFLMLSGYLMARITEPRLAAGADPVRFMAARFRRFWTVVALGSLLGIPFLWVRTQGDPVWFVSALGANLAFLPWPADHLLFPLNVPVWTILAELLANALHVLVLWRMPTRWLAGLVLASAGAALWAAISYGSLDVGARPSNVVYSPPRILLAYGLGILLWRWRGARLSLPAPGWLALPLIPAAMLAAWTFGLGGWPFDLIFILALCPLVIALALGLDRDSTPGRWSAALAFPLFAVHVPALELARLLGLGPASGLVAAFAGALAIGWWTKSLPRRMEPAKSQGDPCCG